MRKIDVLYAERLREGAKYLDSLGDSVGPNNPALSNQLWAASSAVKVYATEYTRRKTQQVKEDDGE